ESDPRDREHAPARNVGERAEKVPPANSAEVAHDAEGHHVGWDDQPVDVGEVAPLWHQCQSTLLECEQDAPRDDERGEQLRGIAREKALIFWRLARPHGGLREAGKSGKTAGAGPSDQPIARLVLGAASTRQPCSRSVRYLVSHKAPRESRRDALERGPAAS